MATTSTLVYQQPGWYTGDRIAPVSDTWYAGTYSAGGGQTVYSTVGTATNSNGTLTWVGNIFKWNGVTIPSFYSSSSTPGIIIWESVLNVFYAFDRYGTVLVFSPTGAYVTNFGYNLSVSPSAAPTTITRWYKTAWQLTLTTAVVTSTALITTLHRIRKYINAVTASVTSTGYFITATTVSQVSSVLCSTSSIISRNITKLFPLVISNAITTRRIDKVYIKLWSMIYQVSKFIGVKKNSSVAVTSTDGTTWVTQTLPSSNLWSSIATNGTTSVAFAINSNTVATTTDGVSWTIQNLPNTYSTYSVAANASGFVAVTTNGKCLKSADAITWTEVTMPGNNTWASVTTNGTNFVAVSANGNSAISTDNGATWTLNAMPDAINYTCVTWALNQYTAVAAGPTNLAAKSADGTTWTRLTMPATADWTAVGPGVGDPNV